MTETAGIILAAGESRRLGQPKQLLDWFGKTFIEKVIDTAVEAQLNPIIVVTGAYHDEIYAEIKDKSLVVLKNERWQEGQSSSMITGVHYIQRIGVKQFVFLLCDQPQVTKEQIINILNKADEPDLDIVFGTVKNKITPPILFNERCIEGILGLRGDQGGKKLFYSYRSEKVEYDDERLIMDADTEKEYKELIRVYSEKCV